jgi:predicted restriction endonuclease
MNLYLVMENIQIEKIIELAQKSNCYNEILFRLKFEEKLEIQINHFYYRKILKIILKNKIDISHMKYFGNNFRKHIWSIPKEIFENIVKKSNTYTNLVNEIKSNYDFKVSYLVLIKRIKLDKIDTSHMTHYNKNNLKKNTNRIDWDTTTMAQVKKKFTDTENKNTRILFLAKKKYIESGRKLKCECCGYDKYVQICHIKGISTFHLDRKIIDINHLDNLVALCPNHHWEFDKGITKFEILCPKIKPIFGIEQFNNKSRNKNKVVYFNSYQIYENLTKKQLSEKYSKKRISQIIRTNSQTKYLKSNKYKKCYSCDYDKHIDICHIKPVAGFSDNCKLSEINSIENLIALCPNHHKEFDRNITNLDNLCPLDTIELKTRYQTILDEFYSAPIKIKNITCKFCSKPILINKNKACQNCFLKHIKIHYRKIKDRPSLDQLNEDLKQLNSFPKVGKKYGVAENTIRKWIRYYHKYKD